MPENVNRQIKISDMKRFFFSSLCALIALSAVSCNGDIDLVQHTTLSCTTVGFDEGGTKTTAEWGVDEKIYLFRAEDWTVAMMSQVSGEGTATANFSGNTSGTKMGYYAIRPASATGAIRMGGTAAVTVEPDNIFFADENSSMLIPQVGTGDKAGLTFKSLFGALKFNVRNFASVAMIQASVPGMEHGLYGTFNYNFRQGVITDDNVYYKVTRSLSPSLDCTNGCDFYLALPAGDYTRVEVVVWDVESNRRVLYAVEDVKVRRGYVNDFTEMASVDLPPFVGGWHLKKYCGTEAPVDLYIEFNNDLSFEILQRTELSGYQRYNGTYSVDAENSIISGKYKDGESWANSYKYSVSEDGELVLQNVSNGEEISVYEPSQMPDIASMLDYSRAGVGSVKPL